MRVAGSSELSNNSKIGAMSNVKLQDMWDK